MPLKTISMADIAAGRTSLDNEGSITVGDSIKDVEAAFAAADLGRQAWLRGVAVSARELAAEAKLKAHHYARFRAFIQAAAAAGDVLNTNTVPDELKRQLILNEIIRAFAIRLIVLKVFTTRFANVPLQGTNKIEVPWYDLDAEESVNFVQADGYKFEQNTTTAVRELLVDRRKYKGLAFNSAEMRRQPYLDLQQLATLKAEKLAVDVMKDILGAIVAANYPKQIAIGAAAAFDSLDVTDLKTACTKAQWPETGRRLLVGSDYDGELQKDEHMRLAYAAGTDTVIREGKIQRIAGFDYFESPNIPDNGENLAGVATIGSSLLVATAPILPGPGVMRRLVNYEVAVHPDLGIALEYRLWGEPQADTDYEVIECNYGFAKGKTDALFRLVSN